MAKEEGNWNPYTWLVGMQNNVAPLESSVAVSKRSNVVLTIQPGSPTPKDTPREMKILQSYTKHLWNKGPRRQKNKRKKEAIRKSINWQTDTQNVVLSTRWNIIRAQRDMKGWDVPLHGCVLKTNVKWEKPDTRVTYCKFPFVWNVQTRQIRRQRAWGGGGQESRRRYGMECLL